MKKVTFLISLLCVILLLGACGLRDTSYGFHRRGSFLENITEFKSSNDLIDMSGNIEYLPSTASTYLHNISYKIKKIDKSSMTATVEVAIPDFSEILSQSLFRGETNLSYDELVEMLNNELIASMNAENTNKMVTEIVLPIEDVGGEYRLVCNDQWNELIVGEIQNLYYEYYWILIGEITNAPIQ